MGGFQRPKGKHVLGKKKDSQEDVTNKNGPRKSEEGLQLFELGPGSVLEPSQRESDLKKRLPVSEVNGQRVIANSP